MMATVRMLEDQEQQSIAGTSSSTFTSKDGKKSVHSDKSKVDLGNINAFPSLPSSTASNSTENTSPAISLASNWAKASKSSISKNTVTDILEIPTSSLAVQKQFGAKAPTTIDLCKQLMQKTNTHIDMSTSKKTGKLTLLISGPPGEVAKVRRELLSKLTAKETIKMTFPAFVTPFIFGAQGKVLQAITNKTHTKIQFPPREETQEKSQDDLVEISISGDSEGVKLAREHIEKIISEKTLKRSLKLSDIPIRYLYFITGPKNVSLQEIMENTDTKIAIRKRSESEGAPATLFDINITGEGDGVEIAAQTLKDAYNKLQNNTRTLTVNIPNRQHKFIVGARGSDALDIFEQTGCVVSIAADGSDVITICGEEVSIVQGLTFVMQKANSFSVEEVNIRHVHSCATEDYYHKIHQFLTHCPSQRANFKNIETVTSTQINIAKNANSSTIGKIEIVGKQRDGVDLARRQIENLLLQLQPSHLNVMAVEPHFVPHLIGRKGHTLSKLRDQYPDVSICIPHEDPDDDSEAAVLLVYTSPCPEKSKVSQTLEKVKGELLKLCQDAADFTTKKISIPSRFHRHIIGPQGTVLNGIVSEASHPVAVKFGSTNQSKLNTSGPHLEEDAVVIKGIKDDVEKAVSKILKVVEEIKHNEVMNSYTIDIQVPNHCIPHIIGKAGSGINKLKSDFHVKIDCEQISTDGNKSEKKSKEAKSIITLQGVKKDVHAVKAVIEERVEALLDTAIAKIAIPHKYHKSLIGSSGKYVKRLEDTYNVRISFGTSSPKLNVEGEGETEGDTQSSMENPDIVTIKGGRKGVESCKNEILELVEFEKMNNNIEEFEVSSKFLSHVVGKGGSRINDIRALTNTRIDIRKPVEGEKRGETEIITLTGSLNNCREAKQMILAIVKELEEEMNFKVTTRKGGHFNKHPVVEKKFHIPSESHSYIIGPRGSRIRDTLDRVVTSYNDSQRATVSTQKKQDNIEKVTKRKGKPSEDQSQPLSEDMGFETGTIVSINDVKVHFPKGEKDEELSNVVTAIAPNEEIITLLNKALDDLVQEHKSLFTRTSEEFEVPASYLWDLSTIPEDKKQKSRKERLQKKYRVEIQVPDSLPEDGDITIRVIGRDDDIAKLKVELLKGPSVTEEIEVDPKFYSRIIGRQGSTIRGIRESSGCEDILIPSRNDPAGSPIRIIGTKESIEKAKERIAQLIQ